MSLDSRRYYERYRSHTLVGEENNLLNLSAEELQELTQNLQLSNHEPSESEQAYCDESECIVSHVSYMCFTLCFIRALHTPHTRLTI